VYVDGTRSGSAGGEAASERCTGPSAIIVRSVVSARRVWLVTVPGETVERGGDLLTERSSQNRSTITARWRGPSLPSAARSTTRVSAESPSASAAGSGGSASSISWRQRSRRRVIRKARSTTVYV